MPLCSTLDLWFVFWCHQQVIHSMATANLKKSLEFMTNTTAASKYIPRRSRISIDSNPTFQTSLQKISKEIFFRLTKFFFRNKNFFSKEQLLFSFLCIVKQKKISEQSENFRKFSFLKIYIKKNAWKVGFQFMLILGLLGMYFDAAVVFVTNSSLFFRLAVAILCIEQFVFFAFFFLFIIT